MSTDLQKSIDRAIQLAAADQTGITITIARVAIVLAPAILRG